MSSTSGLAALVEEASSDTRGSAVADTWPACSALVTPQGELACIQLAPVVEPFRFQHKCMVDQFGGC